MCMLSEAKTLLDQGIHLHTVTVCANDIIYVPAGWFVSMAVLNEWFLALPSAIRPLKHCDRNLL